MSAEGIAAFHGHHGQQVRPALPWLRLAHVTDDADPSTIQAGAGSPSGAIATGPCRAGSPTASCTADGRFHFQLTPDLIPGLELVWHESGHQIDRVTVDREGNEDRLALYTEWAETIGRPELVHDGKVGEYFASGLTKAMTGREGGYITFGDTYPVERARAWYLGLEGWRNHMLKREVYPLNLPIGTDGYGETAITLPGFDPTKETFIRVDRVGLGEGVRYRGHPIGQAGFLVVNGVQQYGARIRVTDDLPGQTAFLRVIAEQQL